MDEAKEALKTTWTRPKRRIPPRNKLYKDEAVF